MIHRELVVVGASAGGIEALQQLLASLPMNFDAALLIVLHTSAHAGNLLPQVLQRASSIPVLHPADGDVIRKRRVYIAPPGFHMLVEGHLIRVIQGPRENLHRPAIDPLFRSAAASWGRRVIGVILTGALDDGTSGLMVVRARGGSAIVQDPATAMFPAMPESALEQVPDAQVLALEDIPGALQKLISEPLSNEDPVKPLAGEVEAESEKETRFAAFNMAEIENERRSGRPSQFACPDCGGVLWELEDKSFLRFRCRVGHAFTARHLGAEQRQAVETALWSALRALEENASLYRRMAAQAKSHEITSRKLKEQGLNIAENARILREFLLRVSQDEDRFGVPAALGVEEMQPPQEDLAGRTEGKNG
jgi:two-component system, chemotaxis family, protein-glutamate methylesterase/glutaminase